MSTAKTHGSAYVYGISETAWTYTTILSLSYNIADRNNDEVPNQSGQIAHSRHDDELVSVSVTFQITSAYVAPTVSNTIEIADATEVSTLEGTYLVKSVGKAKQAKGFTVVTLTLEKGENMTYAAN